MVPIDEGMLQPNPWLCKDTVLIPNCSQGLSPPALGFQPLPAGGPIKIPATSFSTKHQEGWISVLNHIVVIATKLWDCLSSTSKPKLKSCILGFFYKKSLTLKCQRACSSLIMGSEIVRVYDNPVNGSTSVLHKTRDQDVKARNEKDFWTQEPALPYESAAGLRRQTWVPSAVPPEPLPGLGD